MLKQTLALVGLTFSISVNAVIVNTLNGVDYQWLELSHTLGQSRTQIEQRLLDSEDPLYGYQYASRKQVSLLFKSYANVFGVSGWYGNPDAVAGVAALFADFGYTHQSVISWPTSYTTVDGYDVQASNLSDVMYVLHGEPWECGSTNYSCRAEITHRGTMFYYNTSWGWISGAPGYQSIRNSYAHPSVASFLVAPSAIPVPAAGWLFMTALVSLVGKKWLSCR